MDITFWPHIWAIPLLFLLGAVAGWLARSALVDDRVEAVGRSDRPRRAPAPGEERPGPAAHPPAHPRAAPAEQPSRDLLGP